MHYSRMTQYAVAIAGRLAQAWAGGERLSSDELFHTLGISRRITANILTVFSKAGLVTGSSGGHGGYRLAAPPARIRLWDVVILFEEVEEGACGCGLHWCAGDESCPLHEGLARIESQIRHYLQQTTLEAFCVALPSTRH